MRTGSGFLLVDSDILPESMVRVVQAKQLLARGEAKNLTEATRMTGISRSTFYKYRDCVFLYEDRDALSIYNICAELEDRAGVLSSFLAALSEESANILTIHQNIPVDGVALVSVSMQCNGMKNQISDVVNHLNALEGVVSIRMLNK